MDKKKQCKSQNKTISVLAAVLLCVAVGVFAGYCLFHKNNTLAPLPAPELADGIRGEKFYIDKNINETTIDNYLDRDDTVYRMMLMLEDTAS